MTQYFVVSLVLVISVYNPVSSNMLTHFKEGPGESKRLEVFCVFLEVLQTVG